MRESPHLQQPRSLIWRRRILALGTFGATIVAVVVITAATLGGGSAAGGLTLSSLRGHPVQLGSAGHLVPGVQRAAGAPGGTAGAMLVVGGLDDGGTKVGSVQRLEGATATAVGRLPSAVSGAAAAKLVNLVYVFGGDPGPQEATAGVVDTGGGGATPTRSILGVPAVGGGAVRVVAQLPHGITDAVAATIGGTAFVFGGFDGAREVDDVLAWQPGGVAHRTAHLPMRLRFAAAASVGDAVIIAGGMSGGSASRSVLRFDPSEHRVTRIGQLPVALAHAAAATLGGLVFVIGGRRAGPGTETRAIYAIDPASGTVRFAGALPSGLADAAVATVGDRILIAGGINRAGRVQSAVLDLLLPAFAS
jgi:N-acetylneuraminic acid mutarotase